MSATPRLLAGKRRGHAAMLAALALGDALLAVLFADALERLLASAEAPVMALLAAGGIAAMAGATLLLARWAGEDLAQSYLTDCRAALVAAVACQPPDSNDARWLTVVTSDMDALQHYALRGTVRLWTSLGAAAAASLWVLLRMPQLVPGLIPLVGGAGVIALLAWPLARALTAQQQERARMNRFLEHRIRDDLVGQSETGRDGPGRLAGLSGGLTRAALRRAVNAGAMDAAAQFAGLTAALLMVWQTLISQAVGGLAGGLMLLGFIAARLLQGAHALRTRIGTRAAQERFLELLAQAAASPLRPRSHARPHSGSRPPHRPRPPRRRFALWPRWLPLRLNLNLSLPAPEPQSQRSSEESDS